MDLRELVEAILRGDLLAAQQWVADAHRERVQWESVPCPRDFSGLEMTIAAGLVEFFANRAGVNPPSWTDTVGPGRISYGCHPELGWPAGRGEGSRKLRCWNI